MLNNFSIKSLIIWSVLSLFIFTFTIISAIEIPKVIQYQGMLLDDTGQPVSDGNYDITFNIWNWESGGTLLWSSGPQAIMVTDGLFSYQLGSTVELPYSYLNDSTRYLGIQVESDPEIEPRTKLKSVPYAYYAYNIVPATVNFSAGFKSPIPILPIFSYITELPIVLVLINLGI